MVDIETIDIFAYVYMSNMEDLLYSTMELEKKIGIVISGGGTREDLERAAYERLRPAFLAMLKKMISKGYREMGSEADVS